MPASDVSSLLNAVTPEVRDAADTAWVGSVNTSDLVRTPARREPPMSLQCARAPLAHKKRGIQELIRNSRVSDVHRLGSRARYWPSLRRRLPTVTRKPRMLELVPFVASGRSSRSAANLLSRSCFPSSEI